MRILIASDGSSAASNAARYAAQFARPASADITLLGVVAPNSRAPQPLYAKLEALRTELKAGSELEIAATIRTGQPVEQIAAEAAEHFYHLVVVGSRARHGLSRLLFGSVVRDLSRDLSQHLKVPLLAVTEGFTTIRRVLICTSGERSGEIDARIGGSIAAQVGADVKMLHVMSQIALIPDAPLADLVEDTAHLMLSGTREGRHMQRTLEILDQVGVAPEHRHAEVRRGLVLDEIAREAREGNYDLVVIGAHAVPQERSWRELRAMLQENLADEILTEIPRPVLVVRSLDEKAWITQPGETTTSYDH